jgi:hypothetical protein
MNAMNLPEIPQKAKDYFWLLAMMLAFGAVTAAMNRLAGGTGSTVPPPPAMIQVQPVIVDQAPDGTMRILAIEPAGKK